MPEAVKIAVTMFSVLSLAALIAAIVLRNRGRLPSRPTEAGCMILCAVTALANLLGFMPWVALPWFLSAVIWAWTLRHPNR